MYGERTPTTISVKLQDDDLDDLDRLRKIVAERPELLGNIDRRMRWARGYGEASRSEVLRACLRKTVEDLQQGKTVPQASKSKTPSTSKSKTKRPGGSKTPATTRAKKARARRDRKDA